MFSYLPIPIYSKKSSLAFNYINSVCEHLVVDNHSKSVYMKV